MWCTTSRTFHYLSNGNMDLRSRDLTLWMWIRWWTKLDHKFVPKIGRTIRPSTASLLTDEAIFFRFNISRDNGKTRSTLSIFHMERIKMNQNAPIQSLCSCIVDAKNIKKNKGYIEGKQHPLSVLHMFYMQTPFSTAHTSYANTLHTHRPKLPETIFLYQ